MLQVVNFSRRVVLGLAFVSVMGGAGALAGALIGIMLVLLSHVVFGMSAGMLELMPGSVGVGGLLAASLGIFLTARNTPGFSWQPRLVTLRDSKSEQIS